MSNLATLRPFKKGQSGNPNGRPKGARSLTNLLKEALVKIGNGESEPYDEQLVKKVMTMAIKDGNEQMIKLCWNYLEGMPKEKKEIDLTGSVSPEEKEKIADSVYELLNRKTGKDKGE